MMVFKPGKKTLSTIRLITLAGTLLIRVVSLKYLGHWVTEDMSENLDLDPRRALSVRCSMLARRFARCTKEVKTALFKTSCQSLYTCSLWVSYSDNGV